ncbi:metallophosphoesterase [Methanofollis fontis]|uniref:Phosphoesterase n=1 Tax=Methanofollis fontis TaxID=2052832 RepID=A0A483CVH9_9EURY|nr:metallophosphoesterase [Methanofollis fontis]TAJ43416.1 hypothetical protein CUJ86_11200 [Methanofollis fontis]
MLVGIIADTHDNIPLIREAIGVFNREGTALNLHAGDFISPFALKEFGRLNTPLIGVFGNNDGDRDHLMRTAAEMENIDLRGDSAEVEIGSMRIGLVHGHDTALHNVLLEEGGYDAIVSGHSHRPLIGRSGTCLQINPGEACGYLSGTPTVALLETERREVRLVRL